jgi:hypothetical protein
MLYFNATKTIPGLLTRPPLRFAFDCFQGQFGLEGWRMIPSGSFAHTLILF